MKTIILLLALLSPIALYAENEKKPVDYTIKVTSHSKGDAVTFVITVPILPQWISYPPNFQFEHLSQARLEGKNVLLSLGGVGHVMRSKKKIEFTLPKDLLKDLKLKLQIINPTQGNEIKVRTIDLEKVSNKDKAKK